MWESSALFKFKRTNENNPHGHGDWVDEHHNNAINITSGNNLSLSVTDCSHCTGNSYVEFSTRGEPSLEINQQVNDTNNEISVLKKTRLCQE